MPVSPGFRAFVLDQLGRVATGIRSRAMFGGLGLYSDELFFALADDDVLYLKVDAVSKPAFEARGMTPFRPYGPDGEVMNYFAIPGDMLEDAEALGPWVELALEAAGRQRGRSRKKRTR